MSRRSLVVGVAVAVGLFVVAVTVGIAASRSGPGDAASVTTTSATSLGTAVEANATVARVVDGDTLVVEIDGRTERLRMIGIDTPESVKPDSPVECYGPEASAFTAELLAPGTAIRIERDVVGRDDYGRLLGYVYRASDGLFVNRELMRTGHATPLSFPPNTTFAEVFVDDATTAERQSLGLWGACGQ